MMHVQLMCNVGGGEGVGGWTGVEYLYVLSLVTYAAKLDAHLTVLV